MGFGLAVFGSGVYTSTLALPWKQASAYYGPSQGTKLHDELQRLTVTGLTALAIGVEQWL